MMLTGRSSLSGKGIQVSLGIIDPDYRGEVKLLISNHTHETFYIKQGERMAQMIPICYSPAKIECVENMEETERNEGGFGSTGV